MIVSFQSNAIHYCLNEVEMVRADLDFMSFYEMPFLKFIIKNDSYLYSHSLHRCILREYDNQY